MIFNILRLSKKSKIPYSRLLASTKAKGKKKELTQVEKTALANAIQCESSELLDCPIRLTSANSSDTDNEKEWF